MSWVWSNADMIWGLFLDHIVLSVPPIVLGFLLSIPIGWLANRYHTSRGTLLSIGGILYTIPSLPLFIILPGILGTKVLDPTNVIIALSMYALALMVRTTADALAAVDRGVLSSATAIGYSSWRRFWSVELPLAGPVLLAGVRVVSVSTVSLVSVGSIIGVPSLGNLFLDGYQRNFILEIVVGIAGTLLIAAVFDGVLALLGRLAMPWVRSAKRKQKQKQKQKPISVSAESVS